MLAIYPKLRKIQAELGLGDLVAASGLWLDPFGHPPSRRAKAPLRRDGGCPPLVRTTIAARTE